MRQLLKNKWFKFGVVSFFYILLAVVWTGNLWMLLGVVVIYDLYISRLFYKYVWHYNDELCERSALYKSIWGWIDAILWATVAATLLHLFVFQLYKVPTSSMEKTILIGDYLYVSKVTYGPQVPNTPIAMPFVFNTMPWSDSQKSYCDAIQWDYHRLRGLKRIERGDVVVFNYPEGDSVLQAKRLYPAPGTSYYDVLRSYQQAVDAGFEAINMDLIAGLPQDSFEGFCRSLDTVAALNPANITVHTLALKKGADLFEKRVALPTGADVARMVEYANETLRNLGYKPYYLYRQKYMSGSFENVGWSKDGKDCLYNIYMMEELHTILSLGGGGMNKVNLPDGSLQRFHNPKFPEQYIEQIDSVLAQKEELFRLMG